MADCNIVKINNHYLNKKQWAARCPVCKELVPQTSYYYSICTRNTRKTAKDSLYRHLKKEH